MKYSHLGFTALFGVNNNGKIYNSIWLPYNNIDKIKINYVCLSREMPKPRVFDDD